MQVYYKKCQYSVPALIGLKIWQDEIWLFTRRLLRAAKRYLKYGKSVVISMIVSAFFIFAFYKIGTPTGKYNSILDPIWEMKVFIMSTIVLVYSNTLCSKEQERHSALKAQYRKNYIYEYEIEQCLHDLCELICISFHFRVFLSESHVAKFESIIHGMSDDYTPLLKKEDQKVREILNNLDAAVTLISEYLTPSALVNSCDYDELSDAIFDIRKFIREERLNMNNDNTINVSTIVALMQSIINTCYHSIAILRRPWRAQNDFRKNQEIRELLHEHGKMTEGLFDTTEYWY
ncbi:hypothetical protein QVN85_10455 [Oscillibacter valericigenes]|nr:hypothetical protein [Oscillibacter valericigenes]